MANARSSMGGMRAAVIWRPAAGRRGGVPRAGTRQREMWMTAMPCRTDRGIQDDGVAVRSTSSSRGIDDSRASSTGGASPTDATAVLQQVLASLGLPGSARRLLENLRLMDMAGQQALLQHAPAVTAYLRSSKVGLSEEQLARLLEFCPEVFSAPPKQRAAPQFEALAAAGIAPGQAAVCLAALAPVATASSHAAVGILMRAADTVEQHLGLSPAEFASIVAAAGARSGRVPWLQRGERDPLLHTLLHTCGVLAESFGSKAAGRMAMQCPQLLGSHPHVFQRSLSHLAACGVAAPQAALARWPQLLLLDLAAPAMVAWRLLLQRYFGLTAAQLFERHPSKLMPRCPPERLAQRLLFLEQRGELHRLTLGSTAATAAEPVLFHDLTALQEGTFLAALGNSCSQEVWQAFVAANVAGADVVWQWAQQEAQTEVCRLAAALPPELR